MFRYDKLAKHDADDENEKLSPTPTGRNGKSMCAVVHKYINSVLILVLLGGLIFQAVQLHRTDGKLDKDLSGLRQSLQEDIALQKLSENTSNAHVLMEVMR